jgi:hypothetical protein
MTRKSKVVEIEFNPEFQSALSLMDETDKNIFITGRAGTGNNGVAGIVLIEPGQLIYNFKIRVGRDIVGDEAGG